MKVCIPAGSNEGLASEAYGHFGSAPFFVIHDTETGEAEILENANQHHAHGACQPLKALDGRTVDAIIVGGIGVRAITKLNASGIRVYRSAPGTIESNLNAFAHQDLLELSPDAGCQQHGGCDH